MKSATTIENTAITSPFFNAKGQPLDAKTVFANGDLIAKSFYVVIEDDEPVAGAIPTLLKGFWLFRNRETRAVKPPVVKALTTIAANMYKGAYDHVVLAVDHSRNCADGTIATTFRSPELGDRGDWKPTSAGKPAITLFAVGEYAHALGSIQSDMVETTVYDHKTQSFVLYPTNDFKAWLVAVRKK